VNLVDLDNAMQVRGKSGAMVRGSLSDLPQMQSLTRSASHASYFAFHPYC
jgi:hypothetical protein